ncbi:hypothetical protein NDU88_004282 [Pleurodeles waltl]|uniref:Uncharacterized protein n=1 Tax=Pleurodeles waltl TaxID=8319 RepID=A0AAV7RIP7_PLEWA|nr:hypothetical protein NDU88_004282 [Pleurodeles waltl]
MPIRRKVQGRTTTRPLTVYLALRQGCQYPYKQGRDSSPGPRGKRRSLLWPPRFQALLSAARPQPGRRPCRHPPNTSAILQVGSAGTSGSQPLRLCSCPVRSAGPADPRLRAAQTPPTLRPPPRGLQAQLRSDRPTPCDRTPGGSTSAAPGPRPHGCHPGRPSRGSVHSTPHDPKHRPVRCGSQNGRPGRAGPHQGFTSSKAPLTISTAVGGPVLYLIRVKGPPSRRYQQDCCLPARSFGVKRPPF